MSVRNVAVVIFYNYDLNILVQDREGHSKVGEKYGFFGGQIEKDETPKQAMERELLEEIGFIPEKLDYWLMGSYTVDEEGKYKGWRVNAHIFLSPITSALKNAKILEGKEAVKLPLEEVIKGNDFPSNSTKFMKDLKFKLRK